MTMQGLGQQTPFARRCAKVEPDMGELGKVL